MIRTLALAQAAAAPPSMLDMWPVFVAIGLIWWFVLLKPQRDQEKKHKAMLASLTIGQKVVTTGGIYGTVAQLGERTIKLKVADNVKIEVTRASIAGSQVEETAVDQKKDS